MPTVNDENCKPEKIAQIENKEAREQFASACLRRGGYVMERMLFVLRPRGCAWGGWQIRCTVVCWQ